MNRLVEFDKANVTETEFCKVKSHSIRRLVLDDRGIAIHLIATEALISAQLPDEHLDDYLNLLRFLVTKTTDEENEKALVSQSAPEFFEFDFKIFHSKCISEILRRNMFMALNYTTAWDCIQNAKW